MAVGAADRVIANRYALKTGLGPSELGTVWHAQDTLLGREVVVREIVFPPWLAGPERHATQARVLRQAGDAPGLTKRSPSAHTLQGATAHLT
jgi:eukaryotic-like serine/threonine-protein kinase